MKLNYCLIKYKYLNPKITCKKYRLQHIKYQPDPYLLLSNKSNPQIIFSIKIITY